jgi:serine/threonine-protein phosphatase 2A activator
LLKTDDLMKAKPEIQEYFFDGFGSYERIDYGSGHEMNFFAFIYCLYRLGVFSDDEVKVAVLRIFNRYL